MKFSVDLDIDDMMAFQKFYLQEKNPNLRDGFRPSVLIWPLGLILLGLIICLRDSDRLALSILLWLLGIVTLVVSLSGKRNVFKNLRQELEHPDNRLWIGRKEIELDDERVVVMSDGGYEVYEWRVFVRVAETNDHLFLFNTRAQALTIPKQKITSAEVEELRSLFEKHIIVKTTESENKK